jgi:type I restriction enzyme S subunit
MTHKLYPKYKASGVPWLGEVPDHWTVNPFKRQIFRSDGGVWGQDPDGINDTTVLRSTEQTLDGKWCIDKPAKRRLKAAEKRSALLAEGDLVVTKSSGSSLHIGKTTLVTKEVAAMDCCYSNFMQRIRTSGDLSPKFAWFVLNSVVSRDQLDLLSNTTTGLANLNSAIIGKLWVVVPPVCEQTPIADFLERECAKIDLLIGKNGQLIEKLKQKRAALISRAVTRGLPPAAASAAGLSENPPLKSSGVDWLGDVPAHWELKRFQRCVIIKEGQVDPKNPKFSEMVLLAPDHIEGSTGRVLQLVPASEQGAISGKYFCERGAVVYSKIRPALRKVCIAPVDCLCSADMYPLYTRSGLHGEFLYWFMLSDGFSSLAVLESERVAMPKINRTSLKAVPLVVPPSQEQIAISGYLERECSKIDSLITKSEAAIEKLKEYRAALISAAVTGKIDVRDAAQNSSLN